MKPLEIINEIKAGLLNTPVYICSYREFQNILLRKGLNTEGLYSGDKGCYYKTSTMFLSQNIIFINKKSPNYIKVAILFHEYQHLLCDLNCECFEIEDKAEEHAFEAQLKKCLDYNLPKSLKWSIDLLTRISYSSNMEDRFHKKAACLIMKSNLWKKCNKFLKGK